jgi:hypothetical protein
VPRGYEFAAVTIAATSVFAGGQTVGNENVSIGGAR